MRIAFHSRPNNHYYRKELPNSIVIITCCVDVSTMTRARFVRKTIGKNDAICGQQKKLLISTFLCRRELRLGDCFHAQHAAFRRKKKNICSFRAFRFPDTKHFNFSIVQITHVWPMCVRFLSAIPLLLSFLSDGIAFWAHSYHSQPYLGASFCTEKTVSHIFIIHVFGMLYMFSIVRTHHPNFHTQPYIIFASCIIYSFFSSSFSSSVRFFWLLFTSFLLFASLLRRHLPCVFT